MLFFEKNKVNCYEMIIQANEDRKILSDTVYALRTLGFQACTHRTSDDIRGYVFCRSEELDFIKQISESSGLISVSSEPVGKIAAKMIKEAHIC